MNINVHVDRKGSKPRHTSSKSSKNISQSTSRESLHQKTGDAEDHEAAAETSRISTKSVSETKSTQTVPVEEHIKISDAPRVEKVDQSAQVWQPTNQSLHRNQNGLQSKGKKC